MAPTNQVFCVPKKPLDVDAINERLSASRQAAQAAKARIARESKVGSVTALQTLIIQGLTTEGGIPPPYDDLNVSAYRSSNGALESTNGLAPRAAFLTWLSTHTVTLTADDVPPTKPGLSFKKLTYKGNTLYYAFAEGAYYIVLPDGKPLPLRNFDLASITPAVVAPVQQEVTFTAFDQEWTASLIPLRGKPYGKSFQYIRPPGTPKDAPFTYTLHLPPTFWSKLRYQLYVQSSIITYHQGYLTRRPLPSGDLIVGVASEKSASQRVGPLSYDARGEDPGPFGAKRGLLANGTPLVEGPSRPSDKVFDDRRGGDYAAHPEESEGLPAALKAAYPALASDFTAIETAFQTLTVSVESLWYRIAEYVGYIRGIESCIVDGVVQGYPETMGRIFQNLVHIAPLHFNQPFQEADLSADLLETWRNLVPTRTPKRLTVRDLYARVRAVAPVDETSRMSPENRVRYLGSAPDTTKIQWGGDVDTTLANFSFVSDSPLATEEKTFSRNAIDLKAIVLHTGSMDTVATLAREAAASTHFIVYPDGKIEQHVDIGLGAYHTAGLNELSIGVDLATLSHAPASTPGKLLWLSNNGFTTVNPLGLKHLLGNNVTQYHIAPEVAYEAAYLLISELRRIALSKGLTDLAKDTIQASAVKADGKVRLIPGLALTTEGLVQGTQGTFPHLYGNTGPGAKTDVICLYLYVLLRDRGYDSRSSRARVVEIISNTLPIENEYLQLTPL
jgi:hypothetical protein